MYAYAADVRLRRWCTGERHTKMDINRLRMFIAVADCLNFTKAAEKLYISQPTLSRYISELEETMEVELFERTTRRVVLTKAGKLFYDESLQIIKKYDALINRVARLGTGLSGTLKVGYLELFTQNILPVAIRSFHEKFPMVDMQLRETRLQEANQKVLDGELDVGFVITHDMLERKPELEYRHIYAGQVELIVSNQHPLAAYQMVNPLMLKDEKILMFDAGETPELQEQITNMCMKAGFMPNFITGNFSPGAIFLMVQAGMGVSLLSSLITSALLTDDRFHTLTLEGIQAVANLEMIWRKDNDNPCIQNFVSEVEEAAHPTVPNISKLY